MHQMPLLYVHTTERRTPQKKKREREISARAYFRYKEQHVHAELKVAKPPRVTAESRPEQTTKSHATCLSLAFLGRQPRRLANKDEERKRQRQKEEEEEEYVLSIGVTGKSPLKTGSRASRSRLILLNGTSQKRMCPTASNPRRPARPPD